MVLFSYSSACQTTKQPCESQFHGPELLDVFDVGELGEALVRFATNLNPDSQSHSWPKFDPCSWIAVEHENKIHSADSTYSIVHFIQNR